MKDESTNVFHARSTVLEKDINMTPARNTGTDENTNMALDRNTMINASNNNANDNASIADHTACIKLTLQPKHMVTRSHVDLRAGSIGENVAVPVPTVDNGK